MCFGFGNASFDFMRSRSIRIKAGIGGGTDSGVGPGRIDHNGKQYISGSDIGLRIMLFSPVSE